jgi:hypothetical protein
MIEDDMDRITELMKRIEELEAAARRVTVNWVYYQELTDYVEFEVAMRDLSRMVEVRDP